MKSHILQFVNLNLNAKVFPLQKMFTLKEIKWYDNQLGSLTILLSKHNIEISYICNINEQLNIYQISHQRVNGMHMWQKTTTKFWVL